MKKIITMCWVVAIALVISANAADIRGISIDVPEEWELALSQDEDNYSMQCYTVEPEIVSIAVADFETLEGQISSLGNMYLMTCENMYGENDGFHQMMQLSGSEDELQSVFEDCVFNDEGECQYVIVFSRNTGSQILTIMYQRPVMDSTNILDKYLEICKSFFPN